MEKEENTEVKVQKKTWAGLKIPADIYEICEQLKSRMEKQRMYVDLIDFQLFNVATQLYIYNDLVKKFMSNSKVKPKPTDLTSSGESLRRSLRELGLTNNGREFEVQMNDPLSDMLNKMQEDEQPVLTKKKKKE